MSISQNFSYDGWRKKVGNNSWFLIHTLVYQICDAQSLQLYKNFIHSLLTLYPCEQCAHNMKSLKTRETLNNIAWGAGAMKKVEYWAWSFHNEVNEKLKKNSFLLENVRDKWRRPEGSECMIEL